VFLDDRWVPLACTESLCKHAQLVHCHDDGDACLVVLEVVAKTLCGSVVVVVVVDEWCGSVVVVVVCCCWIMMMDWPDFPKVCNFLTTNRSTPTVSTRRSS